MVLPLLRININTMIILLHIRFYDFLQGGRNWDNKILNFCRWVHFCAILFHMPILLIIIIPYREIIVFNALGLSSLTWTWDERLWTRSRSIHPYNESYRALMNMLFHILLCIIIYTLKYINDIFNLCDGFLALKLN